MSKPTTRILLCDDHFVVRSGLAASLSLEQDLEIIAEASDAVEAVAAYEKHRPDLVLMDLQLGETSGINATEVIRKVDPKARILVFSSFARDEDIHRAIIAGALGYLQKAAPREELLEAVRTVASAQRYLPPEIAARLADRIGRQEPSPREREILTLIASGLSNKEIAPALGVSEETVKHHVSNLLAKLDVRDRTQAVTEALRRGLIDIRTR
jgi:two-component system NarL family response regulator